MKFTLAISFLLLSFSWSFGQTQPDGPYQDYYETGELKAEGQYESNKRDGKWKSYYKNGQISSISNYTKGNLDSENIHYSEDGIVSSKVEKEGDTYVRSGYYESGKLKYKREVKSGYFKSYYESGPIEIEANYFEYDLVGKWQKYYENGQIEWIVSYKNGYRDGPYQHFYDNGDLKLEGDINKEKLNGQERRYLPNNILEWEGSYENGVFFKTWTKYDKDGEKVEKVKFKDGVVNDSNFNGELVETIVENGVIERTAIYPGCEEELTNNTRKKCMNQNLAQFIVKNFNINLGRNIGLNGKQRIFMMFKVGKTGEVRDIKVMAPHPILKEEAIRVMNLVPKLEPGQQRGKSVIMPFAIPIVFQVQ